MAPCEIGGSLQTILDKSTAILATTQERTKRLISIYTAKFAPAFPQIDEAGGIFSLSSRSANSISPKHNQVQIESLTSSRTSSRATSPFSTIDIKSLDRNLVFRAEETPGDEKDESDVNKREMEFLGHLVRLLDEANFV